jgi:hypothetical protein
MTPGMPSDKEVPDDAGIKSQSVGAFRRHGLIAWSLMLVTGGIALLLVTGTVGASLVTQDAQLGPPAVIGEVDSTPYLAVTAGDYAVGVVVTESETDILFGATERPLPPPENG